MKAPTKPASPPWTIPTLSTNENLLIDDRLLVARLVGPRPALPPHELVYVSSLWYYRMCRAVVAGGAGKLSGPFVRANRARQAEAIRRKLLLPDDVFLPDPYRVVPAMAWLAERHPHLRLLNLDAAASALVLDAHVALSPAAAGVLPAVLDAESIPWSVVNPTPA